MITYSDQICCRCASPKCSLVRSSSIPVAKFFQSAKSGKIVPKEAAIMESIWHKSTDDLLSSSVHMLKGCSENEVWNIISSVRSSSGYHGLIEICSSENKGFPAGDRLKIKDNISGALSRRPVLSQYNLTEIWSSPDKFSNSNGPRMLGNA